MQPLENVWKDHASFQFILQAQNKISVLFHCAYECVWNCISEWASVFTKKKKSHFTPNIPEASTLDQRMNQFCHCNLYILQSHELSCSRVCARQLNWLWSLPPKNWLALIRSSSYLHMARCRSKPVTRTVRGQNVASWCHEVCTRDKMISLQSLSFVWLEAFPCMSEK